MKRLFFLLLTLFGLSIYQAKANASTRPAEYLTDTTSAKTDSTKPDLTPRIIAIKTVRSPNTGTGDARDVKTEAIKNLRLTTNSINKLCIAYPNDILRFTITNPLAFLKSRPTDQARVVIYANGVEMKGISTAWYSGLTNLTINNGKVPGFEQTSTIDIVLKRNDTTQAAWNYFYANKPDFISNSVNADVSIGWEGMSALEKSPEIPPVVIVFYYKVVFWSYTLLLVLLIAGFGYLAFWTNAIRVSDNNSPYSFSQSQLLFWTTLIISAFIYTLLLTDTPTALNESILLILGISLSTTGAATLIDSRFKQVNGNITKKTSGFFKDVLTSDGDSFSVQRIQTFAWNLVLGLYFIIYTVATKTMPVFSTTLLFLAGISSASYVGAKLPENTDLKNSQVPAGDTTDVSAATYPISIVNADSDAVG